MMCNTDKQLTEDQYAAIEEMSAHGFSYGEIAEVIASEPADKSIIISSLNNRKSKCHLLFRKGFLKSQLELRQRIFKDAMNGSSPAQTIAKKIMDDAEFKSNSS